MLPPVGLLPLIHVLLRGDEPATVFRFASTSRRGLVTPRGLTGESGAGELGRGGAERGNSGESIVLLDDAALTWTGGGR